MCHLVEYWNFGNDLMDSNVDRLDRARCVVGDAARCLMDSLNLTPSWAMLAWGRAVYFISSQ